MLERLSLRLRIFLFFAALALGGVAAIVAGLTNAGVAAGWAALIVGVVFAAIAFAMLAKGSKDLKASNLAPARTTHAVSKDAALAREKVT